MILSHEKRFIFIANGKTGTSSIEKVLNPYQEGEEYNFGVKNLFKSPHIPPTLLKACLKEQVLDEYFKFVFFRNPWDWFVSQWKYNFIVRKKVPMHHFALYPRSSYQQFKKNNGILRLAKKEKFTAADVDFLRDLLWQHRAIPGEKTLYQSSKVYDINGNKLVDYIAKYENIQHEFQYLSEKLSLPIIDLPHTNKTEHRHYSEYFSDSGRKRVGEIWKRDVENFGYKY